MGLLFLNACSLQPEKGWQPEVKTTTSANVINPNTEQPTVLGSQLPNPYLLANMRRAYTNVKGGTWTTLAATNLYVRFKPTTKEQLITLEETLDLDLFDEPLDYQVITEGDYYQDPAVPSDQITWQYAVVPTNFTFPAGITYQTLASVHIPTDIAVEVEAERLAGLNADGDDLAGNAAAITQRIPDCNPGYHFDYDLNKCVPDGCPTGYVWDDVLKKCVSAPVTPPSPAVSTIGKINVQDTQLGVQGLQKLRVVAKRWFKIERMYTNSTGNFTSTAKFRNKVKVILKFKNENASIRSIRGVRFWQVISSVKKVLGKFSGSQINNIPAYTFVRNNDVNSLQTRDWVAATTHNAVQQYRSLIIAQGTSAPPAGLRILISNWGSLGGTGAAPLFGIRFWDGLETAFVNNFIASAVNPVAGGFNTMVGYLKRQIDVVYNYNVSDYTKINSDLVVETIFHELSHTALYTQAGNLWYTAAVDATINEIISATVSSSPNPYGRGNTSSSPIIALNEGWASHYGQFLADARYGTNSSCVRVQDYQTSTCSNGTIRPHIAALEAFNPLLPDDPFKWIPRGLFQDLIDNTPGEITVNDQVSLYTNLQLINAIDSEIRSPQLYRERLLSENSNNQATQVRDLFRQYGYQ
ncbi:hypothetical protein AHMF7616_05275 [Adhaeribacter pallidiroseus]|uniref:Uncharacterized protein n=1 Tax=Adhaeribacter pallidiroseus TaxID=2072847 RepID=A0A369Q1P1_9BACT|nr:hypothetical protein AHMF7616_05275 [Adhaeribacter pallidiroseus]